MSDLKNILGPEEYKEVGKRLEYRVAKIKEKKREKQRLEREKIEKRKTLMDHLYSLHSDKLCQNYLGLVGRFPVYKFRGVNLYFEPDGIYISRRGRFGTFPFNEGYVSQEISCGMGGTDIIEYKIEDLVQDIDKFKVEVSKKLRKKFLKAIRK